jgi:hypothetical protein
VKFASRTVISDAMMRKADTLLKESKKPVLLWIYDEPVF